MKPKPKTKRRINYRLLKQIRDEILKEPLRLDMRVPIYTADSLAPCKTTACIAGWAVMKHEGFKPKKDSWRDTAVAVVAGYATGQSLFSTMAPWHSIEFQARQLLGLTDSQSGRLFHVSNWPDKFKFNYSQNAWSAVERKASARVAARRIEHFIKTRGRE